MSSKARPTLLAIALCAIAIALLPAGCATNRTPNIQATPAPPAPEPPSPKMIGAVLVDETQRFVEATGTTCLQEGILEFIAIDDASAKGYESLCALDCKPSHLHAALLAVGARPGRIPREFMGGALVADDPQEQQRPVADKVRMSVITEAAFQSSPQPRWTPVEEWLTDRSTAAAPASLEWFFNGSFFGRIADGTTVYAADAEHEIAAMWYRSASVMNLAADAGVPYRGAKLGYAVNPAAAPAPGTKIRVRFTVVPKKP